MLSLHKHKLIPIISVVIIVSVSVFIGFKQINNIPNSSAASSMSVSDAQKAVKEVALAYYHRGTNIQYESERRLAFVSPENITGYNGVYHVCTGFTQAVYYEAFGMLIPSNTVKIDAYGQKKYDDIVYYGPGNLSSFLSKLQVGDIVSGGGHAQLVYDFVTNSSGTRTDAKILESIGDSAKIDNADRRAVLGIKSTIRAWRSINVSSGEISVASPTAKGGSITTGLLSANTKLKASNNFTVYRPVKHIADGKYRDYQNDGKLISISADKLKISKSRLKYKNIRISKDSSIHNGNTVNQGATIKYTIKIENMSSSAYSGLTVKENIQPDLVSISNKGDGTFADNVLTWSSISIPAKDYITLTYTVKVKSGDNLNLKKIVSTGTVADIPSTTVTNTIGNTLTSAEQTSIIEAYNNNKSSYKGLELIDKTYKEVFGDKYTLSFKNLKLGLAYPSSSDITATQLKKCNNFADTSGVTISNTSALLATKNRGNGSITVNSKNAFTKAILNGYFNAMKADVDSSGNCLNDTVMIQYQPHGPSSIDNIPSVNHNARIYPNTLKKGDVLVYSNTPFTTDQLKQSVISSTFKNNNIKENGTFAYIWDGENFIGNNKGHSTLSGTDSTGQKYNVNQDIIIGTFKPTRTGEYVNDLSLLFAKDFYVILRPSLLIEDKSSQTVSFQNSSVSKKTTDSKFTNAATTNGNGAITYTSSNTDVATVNKTSGQITIKGAGTTTITATAAETTTYLEGKATYKLTVTKADQTVTFSNKSVSKKTTDANFTNAASTKGNGTISYTSSNTSVATVNNSGVVTIKGAGTSTITATASETTTYLEGKATYKLTVTKNTQTVSFAEASISKTTNDASFTNAATTTGDGAISYSSSDENVATVNNSGTVTIKSAGKTTITASASATNNYQSASDKYVLTVTEITKQNQTVSFSQSSVTKTYGDGLFTNLASTTGNGVITYTSNNSNVASVNETTGQVTITGIGKVKIIATASATGTYNSASASYIITINKKTSIKPSEIDTAAYGQTGENLFTIVLHTEGLDWSNPSETIRYGENTYSVTYTTNNDTDHYTTETFTMTVHGNSIVYPVEEGDGQIHAIDTDEAASFTIDADYSLFENGGKVYIDDVLLGTEHYSSEPGSTIINITSKYLNTLAAGIHTLTVSFNNGGIAGATFSNYSDSSDSPDDEPEPEESGVDPSEEPTDYDKESDQDEEKDYDEQDSEKEPDGNEDEKQDEGKDDKQSDQDSIGPDTNVPDTGHFTGNSDSALQNFITLSAVIISPIVIILFKKSRKKSLHFNKYH